MQTLLLPLIIGRRTQIALWEKGCYVRGRSPGKTGPPGTTGFTAVRGGAIIYIPLAHSTAFPPPTQLGQIGAGENA